METRRALHALPLRLLELPYTALDTVSQCLRGADLKALRLTCKALKMVVEPILFRVVVLCAHEASYEQLLQLAEHRDFDFLNLGSGHRHHSVGAAGGFPSVLEHDTGILDPHVSCIDYANPDTRREWPRVRQHSEPFVSKSNLDRKQGLGRYVREVRIDGRRLLDCASNSLYWNRSFHYRFFYEEGVLKKQTIPVSGNVNFIVEKLARILNGLPNIQRLRFSGWGFPRPGPDRGEVAVYGQEVVPSFWEHIFRKVVGPNTKVENSIVLEPMEQYENWYLLCVVCAIWVSKAQLRLRSIEVKCSAFLDFEREDPEKLFQFIDSLKEVAPSITKFLASAENDVSLSGSVLHQLMTEVLDVPINNLYCTSTNHSRGPHVAPTEDEEWIEEHNVCKIYPLLNGRGYPGKRLQRVALEGICITPQLMLHALGNWPRLNTLILCDICLHPEPSAAAMAISSPETPLLNQAQAESVQEFYWQRRENHWIDLLSELRVHANKPATIQLDGSLLTPHGVFSTPRRTRICRGCGAEMACNRLLNDWVNEVISDAFSISSSSSSFYSPSSSSFFSPTTATAARSSRERHRTTSTVDGTSSGASHSHDLYEWDWDVDGRYPVICQSCDACPTAKTPADTIMKFT